MPAPASGPSDAVARLLEPVVAAAGLFLEDVSVTAAGRRRVVRVVVDAAGEEPGEDLDLDAVAAASHGVSEALDASDVLGEAEYVLEVSSPGVDRPLTTRRHWARARGRLVRAVLADGGEPLLRVVAVDEDGVHGTLEPQAVKGKPPRRKDVGAPRDLTWAELVRGEVQVEFRRAELDALEAGADEDPDDEHDEHDGREDER